MTCCLRGILSGCLPLCSYAESLERPKGWPVCRPQTFVEGNAGASQTGRRGFGQLVLSHRRLGNRHPGTQATTARRTTAVYEARAISTRPRPPAAQSSTSAPTTTTSPQLQPAGLSTTTPILQWPLAGHLLRLSLRHRRQHLIPRALISMHCWPAPCSRWRERRSLGPCKVSRP